MKERIILETFWNELPTGRENAATYDDLCLSWGKSKREVRRILHELSLYDNGDDFVLIRSGKTRGFYKTDNLAEIAAYRKECLNKGRSVFAPVRKCNRVLRGEETAMQANVFNNMKSIRLQKNLTQPQVCKLMTERGFDVDVPMLSKIENGVFLPPPNFLAAMAEIFGCKPNDLVMLDFSAIYIYTTI